MITFLRTVFSLRNASMAAIAIAPISPAIHLGTAAYAGAKEGGMADWAALASGLAMAGTVELLGLGAGHMLAEAIAARRQIVSLRLVAALVAIYVILGMALVFGAGLWGGAILPAGAFILASLVYMLRGLQDGAEAAAAALAIEAAGEDAARAERNAEDRRRQQALEDEARAHQREMDRLAADQRHEEKMARIAAKQLRPSPAGVQRAVQPAVQTGLEIEQMSVQEMHDFLNGSPSALAQKYGIARGTVYNRRPEIEQRLAQLNGAD